MRHQQMIAVTARAEYAEEARLEAQLLVAAPAPLAPAAADPRIGQAPVADLDVAHVRPDRDDLANRFVAHGERQCQAAIGQLELLAAAEVVDAFPDMQVAVTHACREHAQQNLAAGRLRRGLFTSL